MVYSPYINYGDSMKKNAEEKVNEAHKGVAIVVTQLLAQRAKNNNRGVAGLEDKGLSITSPRCFWAKALTRSDIPKETIEQEIKLASAKLRAGDLEFIIESGIGQVAWLSSISLELKEDADRQSASSVARERLIKLSLKAQEAAAKLILSLGALAKM